MAVAVICGDGGDGSWLFCGGDGDSGDFSWLFCGGGVSSESSRFCGGGDSSRLFCGGGDSDDGSCLSCYDGGGDDEGVVGTVVVMRSAVWRL